MSYMPIWPLEMRQRGGAGVTGAPQVNIAAFTPEIGPSIDRRRATSFTTIYNIDFAMLSTAEYTAFRTFFHDTLKDGSLPFVWKHPMTDVQMKCKFYMRDGGAYEETRITPTAFGIRCQVQFINVVENSASLSLGSEIGVWFDFLTGKYAIINEDFEIETGNISSLLTFTRSTTATYFDSAGLLQTAAVDALRYEYDPVTLEIKGALLEGARTNVALWNRDCTNAAWTKTNITAAKTQVGIDGVTNSASSLTATAGNGTCLQAITLASSERLQSAYIKRLVGTGNVQMTTDNGATWTTLTITSSWARYTIPAQTLANPTIGFRLVTSGDAIAVDFVQNENGAFQSSAIATTTVAVARSADNASILLSALPFDAAEGSMLIAGSLPIVPSSGRGFATIATDGNNRIMLGFTTTQNQFFINNGGVTQADIRIGSSIAANTQYKHAGAWKANDFAASVNGGAVSTDVSGTIPTLTTLTFGVTTIGAASLFGYLEQAALYPRRMTNAELVALSVAA